MSYLVFRSDGIPLAEYDKLDVCRDGRFVSGVHPLVNDVFTIYRPGQALTYHVWKVEGNRAYTTRVLVENKTR